MTKSEFEALISKCEQEQDERTKADRKALDKIASDLLVNMIVGAIIGGFLVCLYHSLALYIFAAAMLFNMAAFTIANGKRRCILDENKGWWNETCRKLEVGLDDQTSS
jgi:uncharacterized membrane protein YoaK (UPF0700 family)